MKHLYRFLFLISIFIFSSERFYAQLISGNSFMQGSFVEVGVTPCGSYGTSPAPPFGYHPRSPGGGLGFVADFGRDGWSVGSPTYCGDYFLPGSPVEGWGVEVAGTSYINSDVCGINNIPGSIISYTSSGGTITTVWQGTVSSGTGAGLQITQTTTLKSPDLYFITSVRFCNTTGSTMSNVYYGRNVDPDNDVMLSGGSYTTRNIIEAQPRPDSCASLVTSTGVNFGCFLALGAMQQNARVSVGGFSTVAPISGIYRGYSGGTGRDTTLGHSSTSDEAISIGFYWPTIAAGGCVEANFVYLLNRSDLSAALTGLGSPSIESDGGDISATLRDTACGKRLVMLSVNSDTSYDWTWSPGSVLDRTTGDTVYVNSDTTVTITLTGTSSQCSNVLKRITIVRDTSLNFIAGARDTTVCSGYPVMLNPIVSTGFLPTSYSWTPSTGLSSTSIRNPISTSTYTTTYFLNVSNTLCDIWDTVTVYRLSSGIFTQSFCPGRNVRVGSHVYNTSGVFRDTFNGGIPGCDSIMITTILPTDTLSTRSDTSICIGQSVVLTTRSSGSGASYLWTPSTGLSSTGVLSPTASPTSSTTYVVQSTLGGCNFYDTVNVNIRGVAPTVNITYTPNPYCKDDTLLLNAYVPDYVAGGSRTFSYTGSMATYTVPIGVTVLTIDAAGAQGGTGATGVGGLGGRVQTSLAVTPGQVLNIFVGGAGGSMSNTPGYNGGGYNPGTPYPSNIGGGGGATDIRTGGTALTDRIVVAAGGGGGGYNGCTDNGGAGGGTTGVAGNIGCGTSPAGGGTPIGGGAGGTYSGWTSGLVGTLGVGGSGGSGTGGAGGGGGYYGGGGGAWQGGGGGSSYSIGSGTIHTSGYRAGNGELTITWPTVSSLSPYTYTWSPSTGLFPRTDTAITSYVVTGPATYYVEVNNSGCIGRDTIHIAAPLDVHVSPDTLVCAGSPVQLNAVIDYDTSGYVGPDSLIAVYTGAMQTFTVPAGVTSLTVDAYGAQGANNGGNAGGLGGRVEGTLAVTPGQILYIYVGGQSTGYNGGGAPGAGGSYPGVYGGGGSDIRIGGTALTDRVLVAAGGGGGGNGGSSWSGYPGGIGGGTTGGAGAGCCGSPMAGGASTSVGGTAGYDCGGCGFGGTAGTLGQGGRGSLACSSYGTGSGGGGGYYGGGGGATCGSGGSGGGGSSFLGSLSGATTTAGVRTGDGLIIIRWTGSASSALTYTWTPSTGLSSTSVLNPVATARTTTNYIISVSAGICTASDTASIRVIPIDSLYQTRTICFGESVRVGSRTYSSTGIYRDTFRNSIGCDSLIVTNLLVIRPGTFTQTFCPGIGISVGSHVYNVSGVYRDTFNGGVPGCDSIVVTTILPADTLRSINDTSMCTGMSMRLSTTSTRGGSTYSWSPSTGLSSGSILSPTATPLTTTTYVIQSSLAGCNSYDTVTIRVGGTAPVVDATVSPDPYCKGDTLLLNAYVADLAPGSSDTSNYTGRSRTFTVPSGVTSITIDARGAQGGTDGIYTGGLGARMQGTFAVSPGQVLTVVVGGAGFASYNSGSGGGGSGVLFGAIPWIIAGGGGGGTTNGAENGGPGLTTTTGGSSSGPGGSAGSGGQKGYVGGDCGWAAGGGGFSGDGYGGDGSWDGGPLPGALGTLGGAKSWLNGGAGGINGGCSFSYPNSGPFGCGGGGCGSYGGGGGGGYSGGGAGQYVAPSGSRRGGGGGSYNIGTSPVNTAGYQSGNGQVIITWSVPIISVGTTYSWTPTTGLFPRTDTAITNVVVGSAATYIVSVNKDGCIGYDTVKIKAPLEVHASPDTSVCLGASVGLIGSFVYDTVGVASGADSLTMNFTGGLQTFVVPSGVTSLNVDIRGAQGGRGTTGTGGNGGRVQTDIVVTPGATINIYVGGAGGNLNNIAGYNGGANNPGTPYPSNIGGGGGASDIRIGGIALTDRVVVAGGGGGGGYNGCTENGGVGGGTTGGAASIGCGSSAPGGGTAIAGGVGGTYGGYTSGSAGVFGIGGTGGSGTGGAGGGGGYYGGGGGAWQGGAGGSNYSIGSGTIHTAGFQAGNGQVILRWVPVVSAPLTYSWSPSTGLSSASVLNPTANATATTSYIFTVAAGGCIDKDTATLIIVPKDSLYQSVTICSGQSVSIGIHVYTTGGIKRDTLRNRTGCDSLVVTNIIITTPTPVTQTLSLCTGQTYTINAHTYSSAGIYSDTIRRFGFCDSIMNTTIIMLMSSTGTINESICAGTSYVFNGVNRTVAGSYLDTFLNSSGCDSVVTLNLTIRPSSTGTINASICAGSSYAFNGVNRTIAGSYLDTFLLLSGCDSVVTLNLTIRPTSTGTINASICLGTSYAFNGVNRTIAGSYLDTFLNYAGCDSVVTLNLTVRPTSTGTINTSICAGASYLFNGVNRSTTGSYLDTFLNSLGCDSVVTLNLTVRPTSTGSLTGNICSNQVYLFNGINLNTSGTYLDTFTNVVGCDSIVTLNLTVRPTSTGTINASICAGTSYLFNGVNRTFAGSYLDTFINSTGCDSVVTLNLSIRPTSTGTINASICPGYSYVFNGVSRSTAGSYLDTFLNSTGCDSIVTLNLTISPTSTGTINASICAGTSYVFNGVNRRTAGSYLDTFLNYVGCDSVVTLNLTIRPTSTGTINASICTGTSYLFNGVNRTIAGSYLDTFLNSTGCDSVVTLNLSILSRSTGTINAIICAATSYLFNGVNRSISGSYLDTFLNYTGCDSVVTLNLTVRPSSTGTINTSICVGTSYVFNGVNRTTAGSYLDTFINITGCDSIVTLNLAVRSTSIGTINTSICAGTSYLFNGVNCTTAGSYLDTFLNSTGCDSVVTLNLTIRPTSTGTINTSICAGTSYLFNGVNRTTAGSYLDTFLNSTGCDSVVTLNLSIRPTSTGTINTSICAGTSYVFNGVNRSTAGSYLDTLLNYIGCDSVVTLNLSIRPTSTGTINASICAGTSYLFNGVNRITAGSYLDTFLNSTGCDSIVTLRLSVNPTSSSIQNIALCGPDSIIVGIHSYSSSGTYRDTFSNYLSCDSILTTILVVHSPAFISLKPTICEGTAYQVGASSYTATGIYYDTLVTIEGCDSTIKTDLIVLPRSFAAQDIILCLGQSVTIDGHSYNNDGIFSDTLTSINGCDSILISTIIVKRPVLNIIDTIFCSGNTYDGIVYTADADFTDTIISSLGCDSFIEETHIRVLDNSPLTISNDLIICEGSSAQLNVSGGDSIYSWSPALSMSCSNCSDPIVSPTVNTTYTVLSHDCNGNILSASITVNVQPLPQISILTNDTCVYLGQLLELNTSADSNNNSQVNWYLATQILCSNCNSISFQPFKSGNYYTILTDSVGCTASDSVEICVKTDCPDSTLDMPNYISPNGDGANDLFTIKNPENLDLVFLRIFDRWGELIYESFSPNPMWDASFKGQYCMPGVYVYYIEGNCPSGGNFMRMGNVTIIR